jgi:hypothetical protein
VPSDLAFRARGLAAQPDGGLSWGICILSPDLCPLISLISCISCISCSWCGPRKSPETSGFLSDENGSESHPRSVGKVQGFVYLLRPRTRNCFQPREKLLLVLET